MFTNALSGVHNCDGHLHLQRTLSCRGNIKCNEDCAPRLTSERVTWFSDASSNNETLGLVQSPNREFPPLHSLADFRISVLEGLKMKTNSKECMTTSLELESTEIKIMLNQALNRMLITWACPRPYGSHHQPQRYGSKRISWLYILQDNRYNCHSVGS